MFPRDFLRLILVTGFGTLLISEAENLKIGEAEFVPVYQADHPQHTISLTVVRKDKQPLRALEFLFSARDPENYYRLQLGSAKASLHVVEGGKARLLRSFSHALSSEHSGPILSGDSTQSVRIKRRKRFIYVVVNGSIVLSALDSSCFEGTLYIRMQPGIDITGFRYQPVDDIHFSDNFMQTEEEGKDLGHWSPVSGEWKLHSVMEAVRKAGTANIRAGREPEPQRSVNPFSISSTTKDESIVTAGQSFWDDYYAEVSAMTSGGRFGLVFAWNGPEDYYLLRWELALPMHQSGKVELVKRSAGKETLLGSRFVEGRADNWYRLQASISGGRIQAWIDDTNLFEFYDRECIGGKIGLYSKDSERANFDDVSVRSKEAIIFRDPDWVEKTGEEISGDWKVERVFDKSDRSLPFFLFSVQKEKSPSLFALGDSKWSGYLFRASAHLREKSGELGLACGITGPDDDYLLCRLTKNGRKKGSVELIRVSARRPEKLASFPFQWPHAKEYRFALDLREKGILKFYVNDTLVLRQNDIDPGPGRPGLYCVGPAKFTNIYAFGDLKRDWSRRVKSDIFQNDPYMRAWSSNKWAWDDVDRSKGDESVTFLYKGDVYAAFRLRFPLVRPATVIFGTDGHDTVSGYALDIRPDFERKTCFLKLKRKDATVAEKVVSILPKTIEPQTETGKSFTSWGKLLVHREGHCIWAKLDGKEVLSWQDARPLDGVSLGMVCSDRLDFSHVFVDRDQVLDYLFDRAPVDWEHVGTWEVTNRFACDPRWSHFNGRSFGLASLWNKHKFVGDFTFEFFAGMRMRQGEMLVGYAWTYPRMGDINIAACGDGRNVFSGYSAVLAAWDRFWTEKYTRIYRARKVVAETSRELIPSVRFTRPVVRNVFVDFNPVGRPIHGAWYHIKLRRRGDRLDYFFDNEKVLSFKDSKPLDRGLLAMWTQNNSIMVARAKIAYQSIRRQKAKRVESLISVPELAAESRPVFAIRSTTHPVFISDFEEHHTYWQPVRKEQSALLSLDRTTKAEGESSLKLVNMHAGGDFGVEIVPPPLTLNHLKELSFDYCIQPDVKVNLYFKTLKNPNLRYFIRLTGDDYTDESLIRIGSFKAVADGKWRHASIRPGEELGANDLFQDSQISSTRLGNFHEGYLNAGFGGNPTGATFHLDNFRILVGGGKKAAFEFIDTGKAQIVSWRWMLDDKPDTSPIEESSDASLVEAKEEKDSRDIVSRIGRITVEDLKPGRYFVHAAGKLENGRWSRVVHLPIEVQPTLSVKKIVPKSGASFGGQRVEVYFNRETLAAPMTPQLTISTGSNVLHAPKESLEFDAERKVLLVDLSHLKQTFKDGESIEFKLGCHDNVTLETITAAWELKVDYGSDKLPPSLVTVDGRVLDEDFESRVAAGNLEAYGAVLDRDDSTKASGRNSLKLTNLAHGGHAGVKLVSKPFSLGGFPLFSFDYRSDGNYRVDFDVTGGWHRYIRFTDKDKQITPWGTVPNLRFDGKWHHVELNLKELEDVSEKVYRSGAYQASSLVLADFGHQANTPGTSLHLDNLTLTPMVSSREGFTLKWQAHDPIGIAGYSYKWNRKPGTVPRKKSRGAASTATFKKLPDGRNYFHIRAVDSAGNWGPAAHFPYLLDNTPPEFAEAEPADGALSTSPSIKFQLHDGESGIDPKSLKFTHRKRSISLASRHTSYDGSRGILNWNWAASLEPMTSPIDDGTEMSCELSGISDFAGNTADTAQWNWKIDYSKDETGPQRLRFTTPEPYASYTSFTQDMGYWKPLSERGGKLSLHDDKEKGEQCLRIEVVDRMYKSAGYLVFSNIPGGLFDANMFPLVQFDYKFPPNLKVMLRVYVSGVGVYCIKLTRKSNTYETIGEVPGIIADGRWHTVRFNLLKILEASLLKTQISQIAIGNWANSPNEPGTAYYIDNFLIAGGGGPAPTFTWSTFDSTGISGYRLAWDNVPRTVPEAGEVVTERTFKPPLLDHEGTYYFHVRARDGAGNWGPARHFLYLFNDPPPMTKGEGMEASSSWKREDATKGTSATVSVRSTAGGNRMLAFDYSGPFNKPTPFMLKAPINSIAGRKRVSMNLYHQLNYPARSREVKPMLVSLVLRDGQKEYRSEPQTAERLTWQTGFTFPLTGKVFKTGKSEFNQSIQAAAVKELVFEFVSSDGTGVILLDAVRLE